MKNIEEIILIMVVVEIMIIIMIITIIIMFILIIIITIIIKTMAIHIYKKKMWKKLHNMKKNFKVIKVDVRTVHVKNQMKIMNQLLKIKTFNKKAKVQDAKMQTVIMIMIMIIIEKKN